MPDGSTSILCAIALPSQVSGPSCSGVGVEAVDLDAVAVGDVGGVVGCDRGRAEVAALREQVRPPGSGNSTA